jgi:hypothetical protein
VNRDDSRGRRLDASRAFARRLAADSIASGNDTGWFETLYAAADQGTSRSAAEYVTADLLSPPHSWAGAFDLAVEVFTLQVLTGAARRTPLPTSFTRRRIGVWSVAG